MKTDIHMNIPDIIEESAARRPEKIAVRIMVESELHELTYGAMAKQFRLGARNLRDVGLNPGDRVALIGANSPAWVVSLGYHPLSCEKYRFQKYY